MNPLQEMDRFKKYSIPQVIVHLPPAFPTGKSNKKLNKHVFDGQEVKMRSKRYQVFKNSHVCVNCGIEGQYFWLEKLKNDKCQNRNGRYHFNLYAVDEQGNEVLMTKDHIVPKAKGGNNSLKNLQTMCSRCNNAKGHQLPEEFGC